MAREMKFVVGL